MNYLDFDLEIGIGSGREYPLTVLRSVAGEARETMHFPFDDLALENQLLTLQNVLLRSGSKMRLILSPGEQIVQNFGRKLFDTLFTGEIRSRYVLSHREAMLQGKGLRLRLHILSPKLAALPWEFLYDANQAEFICLSSNTPIVRYLELPQPLHPLTVTLPLSILGMTASPKGFVPLDIEREKLRVEKAIARLRANGLVKLTWLPGQTWQDLQRIMRRGTWHIFHFIGHGGFNSHTDQGFIALEDEDGKECHMNAISLSRLLIDHRSLRLVVLNTCEGARGSELDIFSSTAAMLVRRGMPAVLAMQYEITDMAAIELSRAFYEALADGTPVDMAVAEARKAISIGLANTVEWGTPVLYMRSPDGLLFNLDQKASQVQEHLDKHDIVKIPSGQSTTNLEEHSNIKTSHDENLRASDMTTEQRNQPVNLETTPSIVESQSSSLFPSSMKMQNLTKGIEIFVCFAHEDEEIRKGLEKQLRAFKRQGLINQWYDREISTNTEWEREIDKHLNIANIILLLVSPDFMDSDYCYSLEMKRAMERHERGEARVIPIILRPVYWQGAPFGKLQALPTDAQPITSAKWHNLDEAFFDVAEAINEAILQPLYGTPVLPKMPVSTALQASMKMQNLTKGIEIFVCYAREDEMLRRELELHLSVLQRQGLIDIWHDRNIHAGTEWEQEINKHLNHAQIILLLISPDFMDSDFCYGVEMKRALERHMHGEAYVIPIILRPVYWQRAPFSTLAVLPVGGKPIMNWPNHDEALFEVMESIRKVILKMTNNG